MSFQTVPFRFAVSLALSLIVNPGFAQTTFDKAALEAAASRLRGTTGVAICDPMIDPGCHVPVLGGGGPDGCTDCQPSTLLEALRDGPKLYMPDNLEINGTGLELLQENSDSSTLFALPSQ